MKRNTTRFLLVLLMMLSLCFLCTACGGGAESAKSTESTESTKSTESSTISPQDDPTESSGDDLPVRDEDTVNEFRMYEGRWEGDADNLYDDIYIEFDTYGNWLLYSSGNTTDEGYLLYDQDRDTTYIYSYLGGAIDGGRVELDGSELYITTLGYFSHCASEDDNGNGYYSWDPELFQRNVSEFEGVWYYDCDLSAETYIIIDGDGNWSYYQRTPGDAEGTRTDWGTFSYSTNEVSTYYADSAMYDGVSYRVFEFDDVTLIWDDRAYYRME